METTIITTEQVEKVEEVKTPKDKATEKRLIANKLAKCNIIMLDECIKDTSYRDFILSYDKVNKDKDIYLFVSSLGGLAKISEAICNCILKHEGQGKIIAWVPHSTFSAGTQIALCCDKIYATKHTIFGPCDYQIIADTQQYSSMQIDEMIEYKKSKNEPINEYYLLAQIRNKKAMGTEKKFVKKICEMRKYNEDIFYEEFFSGKYNHEHIFSVQELIDLNIGLDITSVEKLPIEHLKEIKGLAKNQ